MVKLQESTQSLESQIVARIRGKGKGAVVVPADFLDLGNRQAVGVALHRLTKSGTIRRLARGVYDFPKRHPVLGLLVPSPEAIARALSEMLPLSRDELRRSRREK